MAKELDNKKMWESMAKFAPNRETLLWINMCVESQGFKVNDNFEIVPIETELKAVSGQNENQIGGQIGGQKPKFKEGDWIIFNGITLCIKEVVKGYYRTISKDGITNSYDWDIDNAARLWTIADANDGDVVVDKSDETIGIFHCIGSLPDGGICNDPSYCNLHCRYDDRYFYADFENGNTIDSDYLIPATKEQRDTLIKAMIDAGYTFDFEKKELKKIEQKPILDAEIPFGAKGSELEEVSYNIPNGYHAEIEDNKVVIKKGEKKPAEWSKKDEEMLTWLCRIIHSQRVLKVITLKEESELGKWMDKWLNHNPQPHWKPSKGQIKAVEDAIDFLGCTKKVREDLKSLREQLKKLREE